MTLPAADSPHRVGPVCRTGPSGATAPESADGFPMSAAHDTCVARGLARQAGPTVGPVCRTGPSGATAPESADGFPINAANDTCVGRGPARQAGPTVGP